MPKYFRRRRATYRRPAYRRRRKTYRRRSYKVRKTIPVGKGGSYRTKYTATFEMTRDGGTIGTGGARSTLAIAHWASNVAVEQDGKFITPVKVQG